MTTTHRYQVRCAWSGSTAEGYEGYDRTHDAATVPPTVPVRVSSDPSFRGDPSQLNPEALLVMAAASCQLLSFLAVASRARIDVVGYEDDAVGVMPEDDRPVRITRIELYPRITLARPADDAVAATEERVLQLVEVAHRQCFIANSLLSEIVITPTVVGAGPAVLGG